MSQLYAVRTLGAAVLHGETNLSPELPPELSFRSTNSEWVICIPGTAARLMCHACALHVLGHLGVSKSLTITACVITAGNLYDSYHAYS